MYKKLLALSLSLALSSFNPSDETQNSGIDNAGAEELITALIEEENMVGLAVAVSYRDEIIWSKGYGYRDLEKTQAISAKNTLFRIASLSKPFTGTLLAKLHQEGTVHWDSSLYKYVPSFPEKKYDFSLRQLAMHRAGIRHYRWLERENRQALSLEDGLKKFSRSNLKFQPGTNYNYSSYGYNLLGLALQNASQKAFEDLLETEICEPLGLKHTQADLANYEGLETSGFFSSNGKGKNKVAPDVIMYMKMPSGGLLSTAEDLVVFGNALIYQRLLNESTQSKMLESPPLPDGRTTNYALGWGISNDKNGREFYSHTGGNTGSICRIVVFPEQELSIVVLSNTFGTDYLKFIRTVSQLSEHYLDQIPGN